MSTLITHNPDESPEHDPTGVRDLLSSLPQPAPMPDYLVRRINASLADEQTRRAAAPSTTSAARVSPLLAPTRRRVGRLVSAVAGAAAAVVLFAVVGTNLLQSSQPGSTTDSASGSIASSARTGDQGLPDTERKAAVPQGVGASETSPPLVRIRLSETRYTQAGLVTQAQDLGRDALDQIRPSAAGPEGMGVVGTTPGLISCLNAIGAGGAQMVRADLAFYEGRPAVIIVATTNDTATAYVVGRQCSPADPAVLRPATPLP